MATTEVTATKRLRVLVVDDDRDFAESMAVILRAWRHDARVAYTGMAALRIFPVWLPHVVLLDLAMPRMDGFQLAQTLREQLALPHPTLIAVTGYGREEDRCRTREVGFTHHLLKPFDLGELEVILAGLKIEKRVDPKATHSLRLPAFRR